MSNPDLLLIIIPNIAGQSIQCQIMVTIFNSTSSAIILVPGMVTLHLHSVVPS